MNLKNVLSFFSICVVMFSASPSMSQVQKTRNPDEIFGGIKARHIGPALMSGRITDITGHPTNNKIIYIGAAGGGVWKSENGGVTFNPIFDKHNQSIGCVTVDPTAPDDIIWVGTGEIWTRNSVTIGDGIYKSIDGGRNWQHMGLAKSERISSIIVDPRDNNIIYAGVLGGLWSDSEERGVYKSTDAGATWTKILYINEGTGCSDVVMDPLNPDVLYASFWSFRRTAYSFNSGGEDSALYKSKDGGRTWEKIHNGFPTGKLGRIAIAIAPSNAKKLYAVLETELDKDKGLYVSEDEGDSWNHLNGDFELVVRPFYFSRIVVDPKNEDIILKAGLNGSMSKDGGKTFRSIGGGVHSDFHDYWFDPKDSDRIWVVTDGGAYRSWDGGTVWEMVKGLPLSQYYHVTVDREKPYNIYGGLQDNGSWVGPSYKAGGIESRDWISVGYGDGFRVYPDPMDAGIVYSEMQGAENIWRVDLTKNQSKIIKPYPVEGEPKLRFNWNTPITTSVHHPRRLYVGSQFVHVSDDRGETWRKMSYDLTTNDPAKLNQENSGGLSADNSGAENHCTIFTINESPIDPNILWVGTDDGQIQITLDGGNNWTNLTKNIVGLSQTKWVYHIEPSHFDTKTAYVVLDGHTHGDMAAYIFKTTDGGQTWTNIATPKIGSFVRCIREDYKDPNLLFVGSEDGLYISIDGGQDWMPFRNNMPPVAIHHLVIQPDTDDLVMATHGRGIIIIDDVSSLRGLMSVLNNNELTFLPSKPFELKESGSFGGYSNVGDFVGENPSQSFLIKYYLPKRHTFGKMSMEIWDNQNKVVADITPLKSKGLNIVEWGYSLKPPKVAKGKTLAFGGFSSLKLPAGRYTVRITQGKNVYQQEVTLVHSPESLHSEEDKHVQYRTAKNLYDMSESLAYDVYVLDYIADELKGISEQLKDNKWLKKLKVNDLISTITEHKETLVITKGDNYVGSAEPQLREKISTLYGQIAGYSGKPTNAQMDNMLLLSKTLSEKQTKTQSIIVMAKDIAAKLNSKKIETHFDWLEKEAFLSQN